MSPATQRRRFALYVLFFVPGVQFASWIARTPAIRDRLGASTAEMGLILFGLSIGAMAGILASTPLVLKFGTRPVIGAGMASVTLGLAVVALGVAAGAPLVVSLGLAMGGLGMGALDVAMNVEAAEVERLIGRPFLTGMHGCFSLGTVVGALAGIGLTALAFPVHWHLAAVFALSVPPLVLAMRHIPSGFGRRAARAAAEHGLPLPAPRSWRDPRLALIGVVVLAMALAEGAANDWLPLLMVDGHGFGATAGSLVFTGFATAMTIGRFCGGPVIARYGRATVARASAVSGALGVGLVIFGEGPVVVGAAVALWGLGASLGFPVALSAAGETARPGESAAARVGLVATAGYVAFLVGPPLLGFLGETFGLRGAMLVVLVLMAIAAALAPALGSGRVGTGHEARA
ncbi:MFS transporter [Oceanicella sp. SM1341]|uniref:MFS transporter n=1 Tax=Oceanicella sp. SM1341 TaxID=1548889 RepID=UPI000E5050CA|nr:MFS transporter [Oceanicella sp. SM1341]